MKCLNDGTIRPLPKTKKNKIINLFSDQESEFTEQVHQPKKKWQMTKKEEKGSRASILLHDGNHDGLVSKQEDSVCSS